MAAKKDASRSESSRRIEEVKELLKMFALERTVYLLITIVSVLALLSCAVYLLLTGKGDTAVLLGLFGPAGGIIYSTGRLLKMWSEALRVIYPALVREKEDKADSP